MKKEKTKVKTKAETLSAEEAEALYKERIVEIDSLAATGASCKQIVQKLALPMSAEQLKYYCDRKRALLYDSEGEYVEDIAKKMKLSEAHIAQLIDEGSDEILSMYAEGKTYEEIAEAENIDIQSAVNIVRNMQEKADTRRSITLQGYFRAHDLDRAGRISMLSSLRDALMKEIDERGLKEIPIDKLITLLLKTTEQLKIEIENTHTEILTTKEQSRKSSIRSFY